MFWRETAPPPKKKKLTSSLDADALHLFPFPKRSEEAKGNTSYSIMKYLMRNLPG
jgi:hypothetical protein